MTSQAVLIMVQTLKTEDPAREGLDLDTIHALLPDWQLVGIMGVLAQAELDGLIVSEGGIYKWV